MKERETTVGTTLLLDADGITCWFCPICHTWTLYAEWKKHGPRRTPRPRHQGNSPGRGPRMTAIFAGVIAATGIVAVVILNQWHQQHRAGMPARARRGRPTRERRKPDVVRKTDAPERTRTKRQGQGNG